jgi:hypothetical protein
MIDEYPISSFRRTELVDRSSKLTCALHDEAISPFFLHLVRAIIAMNKLGHAVRIIPEGAGDGDPDTVRL